MLYLSFNKLHYKGTVQNISNKPCQCRSHKKYIYCIYIYMTRAKTMQNLCFLGEITHLLIVLFEIHFYQFCLLYEKRVFTVTLISIKRTTASHLESLSRKKPTDVVTQVLLFKQIKVYFQS